VATPKVCGIETEYGILLSGAEVDPITASSLIVSAYKDSSWAFASFDASHESPSRDIRGVNLDDYLDPVIDTKMINTVLSNGARYYVDHAHPEYSSPECATIYDAVLFDVAGEFILRESMNKANERLPHGIRIDLYKNNSDGKGNSYGCHENYLIDRQLPFAKLAAYITTHFVTRQIFCGSGKVGHETPTGVVDQSGFQISQRADFFEELVGLETTMKRPIVNTRDEPHCDPQKYRRLHVIVGDANMSQFATYLKLGSTALVLSMIEDDMFPQRLLIAHPVHAIKQISRDVSMTEEVLMADGSRMTALAIQAELCAAVKTYVEQSDECGLSRVEAERVLYEWEHTLHGLATQPNTLITKVDWIAKMQLVDGTRKRHSLSDSDSRLKAIDLMYHSLDPKVCLATKLNLHHLFDEQAIIEAAHQPPETTRAFFRGRVVDKWFDHIVTANWDSIVFDVANRPLQKVYMNEPLKGTRKLAESIINSSSTVEELLSLLGQQDLPSSTL
jgi:proteasome accessory factor A